MAKIIYYAAASLDGYIACDDGSFDWLPVPKPGRDYGYAEFLARTGTLVIGRKSYEQLLGLGEWPYGDRTCYVLSRKWAGQPDPRARFFGGDVGSLLRRLRRRPGKDVWVFGGGESAHACLETGLVDEIVVTIVPVLLGAGRPLFLRSARPMRSLRLRKSQAFPDGLVQLEYGIEGRRLK